MKTAIGVLAGLAFVFAMPARAEDVATPSKSAAKTAPAALMPSAQATRVADWVSATNDNRALPYAIIDKQSASISVYNAKRKLLGTVPVLIGVASGDEATPGIGSKNLAEIGPAEKTTPAGRFLAKFGRAAGKQKVLWVDYATSVALHPIPPGASKKERRSQRMASPTPDDNRITFGCINVPGAFYGKNVSPLFARKGGYVYILPDTKAIEDVFPPLRAEVVRDPGAPGSATPPAL
ncbi:MAG: hypothetical protein B7Z39_01375 [Novosphingobium sp. 12-64-8]|nr:MAG: hypothetical protein B7Z39_01375 [Novosphingobium sp. 12-64-8]